MRNKWMDGLYARGGKVMQREGGWVLEVKRQRRGNINLMEGRPATQHTNTQRDAGPFNVLLFLSGGAPPVKNLQGPRAELVGLHATSLESKMRDVR